MYLGVACNLTRDFRLVRAERWSDSTSLILGSVKREDSDAYAAFTDLVDDPDGTNPVNICLADDVLEVFRLFRHECGSLSGK